MFLVNKTVVYGKLETTPYTWKTDLADADFNVRVSDISYSLNVVEYRRKIADGTLDYSGSVKGKQTATVSFKIDLAPAPAVATEPEWSKLLKACGLKAVGWDGGVEVAVGSAVDGISWTPHSDTTHIPVTLEIQEIVEGADPAALRIRLGGAMGNVTISCGAVGEPLQANFEFQGVLDSIDDRTNVQRIDHTTFSTVCPPPVLAATATINSVAQDFDSFEFNMNNDVQPYVDPSKNEGVKGFYIAGREPQLSIDPTMKLIATEDWYGDLTGDCTTARAISVALSSTPLLTLTAPKGQEITVGAGDRNGARTAEKNYLLIRDSGNDVFRLLQGATT